jgi:hypothetical protein
MAFPSSRKILPLLLPLLFVGLAGLLAAGKPTVTSEPAQQAAQWKTYRAPQVPFEFSYPGSFLLDAHVNPKLGFIFALMKKPDTPWLIDIDFANRADFSMAPYTRMSLEEFAIARAQLTCQADGPEGSVSCPSVAHKQTYRNQNGLEVVELYLNRVNERYDPPKIEKSVVGAIEVVLLPTGKSGQVLTFRRTDKDEKRLVSDDLLRRMADLVNVPRWPGP